MLHIFTSTVEEYLRNLGRCVEGFEPPTDAEQQFKILSNITKNTKILNSLQVKYSGMSEFVTFTPNATNYHQFNALVSFNAINMMGDKCFIMKANHSNGGIFTATFYQKGHNMIEYISEMESKVEFKFDM